MICSAPSPVFSDLNVEQESVIDAIIAWRDDWPGTSQIKSLGGLAGTGKTTVVAELARRLPDSMVLCPTGKAANVLQGKGIDARTIHSQIYEPRMVRGIMVWRPRRFLNAGTLIVDEASMVNTKLLGDLCSFSKPILFVGDHGQLEPVGESPNLMKNPDLRLETIRRQAQDNPIIRLAAAFREGREKDVWKAMRNGIYRDPSGNCTVTTKARVQEYLYSGMQVLVGFNSLRREFNEKIRSRLGYSGLPCPGERLICLRNNPRFQVYNGQEFTVTKACAVRRGVVELEVVTDNNRHIVVPCLGRQFGADPIKDYGDAGVLLMDFAHVLTVHKAQGSAWPGVLVVESIAGSWDARRWRYTAVTRASESIVYCR